MFFTVWGVPGGVIVIDNELQVNLGYATETKDRLCYVYVYVDRSLFVAVVVCGYQLSPFYVFLLTSRT